MCFDAIAKHINNKILYIQETSSIIYQESIYEIFRYSILNAQGYIISTYYIYDSINLEQYQGHFIINNFLYLINNNNQYQLINLNYARQGQILSISTQTFSSQKYQEVNNCKKNTAKLMQNAFFYACLDPQNIFLLTSYNFQDLLNSSIIYYGDKISVGFNFIKLDNKLFLEGENYFKQISAVSESNSHLINLNTMFVFEYESRILTFYDVIDLSEIQSNIIFTQNEKVETILQIEDILFIDQIQYKLEYDSNKDEIKIVLNSDKYSPNYRFNQQKLTYLTKAFDEQLCEISNQITFNACLIIKSPIYVISNSFFTLVCPVSYVLDIPQNKCVCQPHSTQINDSCICNSSYIKINGVCKKCSLNCLKCKTKTSCSVCEQGYYLDQDGLCIYYSQSKQVENLNNLQLEKSQILVSNSAQINNAFNKDRLLITCNQYCTGCTSPTVCTGCQTGFYLGNQGGCINLCFTNSSCQCQKQSLYMCSQKGDSGAICQSGQYTDINGSLQPCPANCNTLSPGITCTVCQPNSFLHVDGTCVSACPLTFTQNNTNQTCQCRLNSTQIGNSCPCNTGFIDVGGACQPCSTNCQQCSSQTNCIQCAQGYYLFVNQTCIPSCPATFVTNNSSCVCRSKSTLSNNTCPCNTGYLDIGGNCLACGANCNQCSSQTNCTTCASNYFLFIDGTCINPCPATFIANASNQQCICRPNSTLLNKTCPCNSGYLDVGGNCLACGANCNQCSSQTNCITCAPGYFLFIDGTCQNPCPATFVENNTNQQCTCRSNSTQSNKTCPCNTGYLEVGGNCLACGANCNQCSSQTTCTTCSPGYFLFIDGTCQNPCPATFVQNNTNQQCTCRSNSTQSNKTCPCNTGYLDVGGNCLACGANCNQCSSQTTCTTCASGYFLFIDGTCQNPCPATFVENNTNQQCTCRSNSTLQNKTCPCNTGYLDVGGNCQACGANCNQCSSLTTCTTCASGYFLFIDGTCQNPCPATFIQNNTNQQCTCRSNSTLLNKTCPCNSGYLDVGGNCLACGANCNQCSSQTTCTTCASGYFLFIDGTCQNPCPATFVQNNTNKQCTCRSNSTLQNQACPCNTGYLEVGGNCLACGANCNQCSSQTTCTTCSPGYFLFIDGTCQNPCPATFVQNNTNQQCICRSNSTQSNKTCPCNTGYLEVGGNCLACGANCNQCSSQTTCTTCASGYFLFIDGTCQNPCPATFVQNNTNQQCTCRSYSTLQNKTCPCNTGYLDVGGNCLACGANCNQCSSQTTCTTCSPGYFLFIDGTCQNPCPATFVQNNTNQQCTCRSNSTLLNKTCPCNTGYLDVGGNCLACGANCNQCSSQTTCTTCAPGYFLFIDGTCQNPCPATFVENNTNQQCTCRSNSTLQNKTCPCNTGYLDVGGNCLACGANCNQCSSQTTCTTCASGYFLFIDSTCQNPCPATFVQNNTNQQCTCRSNSTLLNKTCPCNTGYLDVGGNCLACGANCNQCSSQTTCTTCASGYFLFIDGTCQNPCPATFVENNTNQQCTCRSNSTLQNKTCPCNTGYLDVGGNCLACGANCSQCSSQTTCTTCASGYFLFIDGTCQNPCPYTFVKDTLNQQCTCRSNSTLSNKTCPCNVGYLDVADDCLKCGANCSQCSSQKICTKCSIGYLLLADGTCAGQCPSTFIIDSSNSKCICRSNSYLLKQNFYFFIKQYFRIIYQNTLIILLNQQQLSLQYQVF
ncbi:hypothetical protein ABPG74_017298 [Tetrahymena malaccensis]